jgi:tetratricopeptide (TPR) repeat protein
MNMPLRHPAPTLAAPLIGEPMTPGAALCPCGSGLTRARCCGMDISAAGVPGSAAVLAPVVEAAEQAARDGDPARAASLCVQALELAPWLAPAISLLARLRLADGALAAASALFGRIVALDPNDLIATCEAARVLLRRGDMAGAEHHARNAVRIAPLSPDAHNLLAMAMTEGHRPVPGERHYRRALVLSRGRDPILLANLAWNLKQQGRVEESRALYEESLAVRPDELQTLLGFARLEEAVGRLAEAAAFLERAAALAPSDPAVTLTQAVVAARTGARTRALAILEGDTLAGGAAPAAMMERGRLLDRMGRHDDAFTAWTAGKQRLREITGVAYDEAAAADAARRLRGFFTDARRRLLPRAAVAGGPQPLFVLGFPRSGTTLVEQSLSAHPRVSAGDELPLIHDLAAMVPRVLSSPLAYPDALADLWLADQGDALETLRDHYLRRARAIGIMRGEPTWFTDKMPLNETHMGLIGMVFPASPMIHVVRHPLDVVLSVFGNELTHGMNCAAALESAARHYVLAADLVAHYRGALALRYLGVRYEDMVDDHAATVRRMLDFAGLPFARACLAFHKNRRYARTASYAQVTEKLYARSRYRYRHYLRQLAPVIPILEPVIARLGYTI